MKKAEIDLDPESLSSDRPDDQRIRQSKTARLGDLLVSDNFITSAQLADALACRKAKGGRLATYLVTLGFISEDVLESVLSRHFDMPLVDLTTLEIDHEVLKLVPRESAVKHQVMPIRRVGNVLTIATVDPGDILLVDEMRFRTGLRIETILASESQIREAIDKHFGTPQSIELKKVFDDLPKATPASNIELLDEDGAELDSAALESLSEEAPIIRLVNFILVDSLRSGASDVHIEPFERELRIRFRVDGVLKTVMTPPVKLKDSMTSRIKIMAKLNISEKRVPQDGRIRIRTKVMDKMRDIDFRVSVLPSLFGEKIVLRLLDKDNLMFDMLRLGFDPQSLTKFEKAIQRPYGMVLVTGPTGSGKTNTLYSAISRLNRPDINIMTAEDPVEFNLHGITQVQIHEQVGLTFAAALRSFLRQDPNVILVGEIRDVETAEIAIKASLTGHLVLSTLHTNDAPTTISRLLNMGIETFLLATSVQLVCAQRLARRICQACKIHADMPPVSTLLDLGFEAEEIESLEVFRGAGCKICNGSGYKGRVGLYEVLEISEDIKEAIILKATSADLKKLAVANGMVTLRRSGLRKVRDGVTTIEEVVRETIY